MLVLTKMIPCVLVCNEPILNGNVEISFKLDWKTYGNKLKKKADGKTLVNK